MSAKIPLTREGSILKPTARLAPGIFGYAVKTKGGTYIPFIAAEHQGDGTVGKWLNELPSDRRIVFPTVLSARLAGMLKRRGFREEIEAGPDEPIKVLARGPLSESERNP